MENLFDLLFMLIFIVSKRITTLMAISDGLDPYFFLSKDGKCAVHEKKLDGEINLSHQSRHFSFIDNMVKALFPIYSLNWRVDNDVSRQGKGISRKNETTINIKEVHSTYCTQSEIITVGFLLQNFKKANYGNIEELEKVSSSFESNIRKYKQQSVTKHTWSGNGWRVHRPSFWRNRRKGH